MKKYLIVGKSRSKKNPKAAGGVITLYEQLKSDFTNRKLRFEEVDLNIKNYQSRITGVFKVYITLLKKTPKVDMVFFNGTAAEYKYYSWFVVLLGKLFRTKVVLRKFAGSFHDFYSKELNFITRPGVKFALKNADISYFETKYLIRYFRRIAKNPKWFPNVRSKSKKRTTPFYSKKFVFVGWVTESKGIIEILKAKQELGDSYQIDIYGPKDYIPAKELTEVFENCYKGVLDKNQVQLQMSLYDVLLLPTYHGGEGYPGVIIEALSLGIPIITTPLEGIKEMVNDNENCLFVEPKNYQDLVTKMKQLNTNNYKEFSENAIQSFQQFDSDLVMERVFKDLEVL